MSTGIVTEKSIVSSPILDTNLPWRVILWNDPINLISYVTWVLQNALGFSSPKATELTMEVHNNGRAIVSHGPREKAELDATRLHQHGLWATLERDSD